MPSNGDVAAFDTEDGINFYIAVNNELMRLTVGETETVRSTLKRVASTVVDIDLNGDYLVFSYGGESTEIWSVSASDGAFIDRTPTFSEGEEAQFQGIAQLHYLTNAQSYLLRLSEGPVIYLGFDPSTGQFGPYDGEDRLADDAAVGSDDKLYFSHQHDLAVSASVVAYRYDDSVKGGDDFTALSIDEKGSPTPFIHSVTHSLQTRSWMPLPRVLIIYMPLTRLRILVTSAWVERASVSMPPILNSKQG